MVSLSDGSQGEIEKDERELWGWSAGDRISRDVMRQSVRGACFGVVLSPTGSFNGFYSLNAAFGQSECKVGWSKTLEGMHSPC